MRVPVQGVHQLSPQQARQARRRPDPVRDRARQPSARRRRTGRGRYRARTLRRLPRRDGALALVRPRRQPQGGAGPERIPDSRLLGGDEEVTLGPRGDRPLPRHARPQARPDRPRLRRPRGGHPGGAPRGPGTRRPRRPRPQPPVGEPHGRVREVPSGELPQGGGQDPRHPVAGQLRLPLAARAPLPRASNRRGLRRRRGHPPRRRGRLHPCRPDHGQPEAEHPGARRRHRREQRPAPARRAGPPGGVRLRDRVPRARSGRPGERAGRTDPRGGHRRLRRRHDLRAPRRPPRRRRADGPDQRRQAPRRGGRGGRREVPRRRDRRRPLGEPRPRTRAREPVPGCRRVPRPVPLPGRLRPRTVLHGGQELLGGHRHGHGRASVVEHVVLPPDEPAGKLLRRLVRGRLAALRRGRRGDESAGAAPHRRRDRPGEAHVRDRRPRGPPRPLRRGSRLLPGRLGPGTGTLPRGGPDRGRGRWRRGRQALVPGVRDAGRRLLGTPSDGAARAGRDSRPGHRRQRGTRGRQLALPRAARTVGLHPDPHRARAGRLHLRGALARRHGPLGGGDVRARHPRPRRGVRRRGRRHRGARLRRHAALRRRLLRRPGDRRIARARLGRLRHGLHRGGSPPHRPAPER